MNCRHCGASLEHVFVDLGHQPPSNAYLTREQLDAPEITYPLRAYVCDSCWLVQVPEHARPAELFTENYAYFSSVSSTWVEHARRYVEDSVSRYDLSPQSFVVEIASNDGYLLQFMQERGIPCLGIEPTACTAAAARRKGIETMESFFTESLGRQIAEERRQADLIIGNNVFAHVPDVNDFARGVRELLAEEGVATFEFPHLLELIRGLQFDTIYHEHYSYLSLTSARAIFDHAGLKIVKVERLPTHGGSLRLHVARHSSRYRVSSSVEELIGQEKAAGLLALSGYTGFQKEAERIKDETLRALLAKKEEGSRVGGYGAAAKGNTLLNFAGIRSDLLPYVCDAAPSKQGKFLPGSHIPIVSPDLLLTAPPQCVWILPWNLRDEICCWLTAASFDGEILTAIPRVETIRIGN